MNKFLEAAASLKPELRHAHIVPCRMVRPLADDRAFQGFRMELQEGDYQSLSLGTGDCLYLDFGKHLVGHLSLRVELLGTRQDAPAKLRFAFGEMPCELMEPFDAYKGWISSAWLQEELLFIDKLPADITLPRRYAFRYLKIEVAATSVRFQVKFSKIACDATTSANDTVAGSWTTYQEPWKSLCEVSAATLGDCMQHVFEDGPKRDRRLWMGDLRLQALANYVTFQNNDLVKRCLYLFAGTRDTSGKVSAALYDTDPPIDDENCLVDYSLLFTAAVEDYRAHTLDDATTRELFPVAMDQLRLVFEQLDEQGLVTYKEGFTCFIDWNEKLNKRASAQGVYLYCLRKGRSLAEALHETEWVLKINGWIKQAADAAMRCFWDEDQKCFISGIEAQRSWASQIWMILGQVLSKTEAQALLNRTLFDPPAVEMVTPYMMHYLIEAMILLDETGLACEWIGKYWGGMIALSADCFWEIYLPNSPDRSPYGSNMIHSYCHAWSCTPVYFIEKYQLHTLKSQK